MDLGHPGQSADPFPDVALDLGPEGASRGGEGDGHVHQAIGVDTHSPSHAQLDDVAPQLGVDHPAEHAEYVLLNRWRRFNHSPIVRRPGLGPWGDGQYTVKTDDHRLRLEDPMLTLTDDATTKVGELISSESEEGLALRVAVRPGGCSGFSYEMYFDTDRADDDLEQAFGDIRVVVDPSSAQLLEGATLDYKDGLNEAGFSINNPNAQRTCGCGQSFS